MPKAERPSCMRLYVAPMDVTVVEVSPDGRVKLDTGEWLTPTLQERRAIIYAAEESLAELRELIEALSRS
jgi:hypothetical protein